MFRVPIIRVAILTWTVGGMSIIARSPAWAAPAEDESLNNRGVELRAAGRDSEARDVFQRAYDLTHSPRAAAQLGLAYQALGRWEAAEPLVSEGLAGAMDPWINKYRKTLEEDLVLIQNHVAHIELTGEPPDAEVYVNGRPSGRLPMTTPLAVSIGTVDIELRAPGHRNGVRQVTLGARQYERVFVRLQKESTPPPAETATAASTAGASGTTSSISPATAATLGGPSPNTGPPMSTDQSPVSPVRRVLKWTSLGLAVAGLGTGITASIIHDQKVNDFAKAHMGDCADKGGTAVDSRGAPVSECQSLLDSYRAARTWQVVGFIAAGVFAAGWLALQLTEPSATGGTTTATAWACVPSLSSAGEVAAGCAVRF